MGPKKKLAKLFRFESNDVEEIFMIFHTTISIGFVVSVRI